MCDLQVHFPPEDKIKKVHHMVSWSYAYQEARKGRWMQCAVDEHRFRNRIQAMETIIAPILTHEHRDKLYRKMDFLNRVTPSPKKT